MHENPLLEESFPVPFHRIRDEHVVPAIRRAIEEAKEGVEALAADREPPSWKNVLEPLDELMERVGRVATPVQHLLSVRETPELREVWAVVLPELTRFWSWLHLHEGLFGRLRALESRAEDLNLDPLRARHLVRTMRDFRRAGAELPPPERERLEAIQVELAGLGQSFSENILDATARYNRRITDPGRLSGIPEDALERFRKKVEAEGREGWVLTLDEPSYLAVMQYAEDPELRRELHRAYQARGREAPTDNRPLIPRILELRREMAELLGYPDFPDYRLEEQMAGSGARARAFVEELAQRTRPFWERDVRALQAYGEELGIRTLEPWDIPFLIERMRREELEVDQEEVREYFPLDRVIGGLFRITERLFGLRVNETPIEEVWHPDVRYYELWDESGTRLGGFYADLFPRPEKRQGAWMNDLVYGGPRADGAFSPHLGLISANFPPPGTERPALLTHRDVETLLHEFGHLLHHMTSRIPIPRRGGVSVAWDWVELPSQLLQNWAWEEEPLELLSGHWETGESLPGEILARLLRSRRFMGGWRQMRQLSFGTLDLALHTEYETARDGDAIEWVSALMESFAPSRNLAEAHPLPSFLHLFSGGYAASYYSYLWSEVLGADIFTRFVGAGLFNGEMGRRYLETILATGDSEDPEILFRTFMGREPDPEALIARNLG